uniref:Uncharacterized protein n=1 Tax=Arundo donax TaxID=35708 RepID=A0A0A9FTI8_ARUDO
MVSPLVNLIPGLTGLPCKCQRWKSKYSMFYLVSGASLPVQ